MALDKWGLASVANSRRRKACGLIVRLIVITGRSTRTAADHCGLLRPPRRADVRFGPSHLKRLGVKGCKARHRLSMA